MQECTLVKEEFMEIQPGMHEQFQYENKLVNENSNAFSFTPPRLFADYSLGDTEYKIITTLLYNCCRINLDGRKKEMVQSRLNKRLRELDFTNYKQYISYVMSDKTGRELTTMVDLLTTNLTYFFREPKHFDYMREEILPKIDIFNLNNYRIWSAGSSSGEEAYTIATVMKDFFPNTLIRKPIILATDISHRMLDRGIAGKYNEEKLKTVPVATLNNHFYKRDNDEEGKAIYKVKSNIASMVRFCYMNLVDKWPIKGSFDIIFCRNVMIYFDKRTQMELISRYYNALKPGGTFIIGHSESLSGLSQQFQYVQPSIYQKPL